MAIEIGSKYEGNRDRLKVKVGRGELTGIEKKAGDNACYFCLKKIDGSMYVLTEMGIINSILTEVNYFLDRACYEGC